MAFYIFCALEFSDALLYTLWERDYLSTTQTNIYKEGLTERAIILCKLKEPVKVLYQFYT